MQECTLHSQHSSLPLLGHLASSYKICWVTTADKAHVESKDEPTENEPTAISKVDFKISMLWFHCWLAALLDFISVGTGIVGCLSTHKELLYCTVCNEKMTGYKGMTKLALSYVCI